MASLYEIDRSILECIDLETGEVIDAERLEHLQMDRNQKIENIALWIKNLQSDAMAYKAEKDAFAEREQAATKKAEQLKAYLAQVLEGQKFSTARCAVSFRRSESVTIEDENSIPQEMMVQKVEFKPDKKAIKELLKGGFDVPGCRLVENWNTQIK